MKALQCSLGVFLVLLLAGTAVGQNDASTAYPPDAPISAMMTASPFLGAGAGHGVYNVKGSPFSADVDYEFTQVLAGENRVHRESHGRIYRDGEGRIRNEIVPETPPGPSVTISTIIINDPVSQTMVTWHPDALPKSAVVDHMSRYHNELGFGLAVANSPASGTSSFSKSSAEMLEQHRPFQQPQGAVPTSTGRKGTRPGEDLGAKEIEGFTALGIRFSGTIPAGQIGNEKPITKMEEIWWCKDLKAVLVSIHDDPQTGRRIMRLTNIQIGEPDSQLFRIPPDYQVQELTH